MLGLHEASVVAMAEGHALASGMPAVVNVHTAGGVTAIAAANPPTSAAASPGLLGMVTIEDVGHWPQLESSDRVSEALLSFLNSL